MNWQTVKLDTTTSTHEIIKRTDGDYVVVVADYQEAGHGQGQNKWESERGKNLLFSVKMPVPEIPANRQFLLSMAGALALKDVLDDYADGFTLKWPNDIYWQDRKTSGTIIDTTISGKVISQCIYGIGINLNQRVFTGDAPNPVSLCTIVGHDVDRNEVLEKFLCRLVNRMDDLAKYRYDDVTSEYSVSLYRRNGFYEYEDCSGRFSAEIVEVLPNGHLVLCDSNGKSRDYELKEVKFII